MFQSASVASAQAVQEYVAALRVRQGNYLAVNNFCLNTIAQFIAKG
jgi:hypothetical protein